MPGIKELGFGRRTVLVTVTSSMMLYAVPVLRGPMSVSKYKGACGAYRGSLGGDWVHSDTSAN